MRKSNGAALAVVAWCALAGCDMITGVQTPKCSDEETLELVRAIIGENTAEAGKVPSAEVLRQRVTFEYPHATKLEENIRKYSCEATMVLVNGDQRLEQTLVYESQLDDAGDHLVQVVIDGMNEFQVRNLLEVSAAPALEDANDAKNEFSQDENVDRSTAAAEVAPAPSREIAADHAERVTVLDAMEGASGEYPRMRDYAVDEVYAGPAAPLSLASETAREYRARLREALLEEIAAGGEYVQAGWGCGAGCYYATFINKRTGVLIEEGIGGEMGERIVAMHPSSQLVVTEGPEIDDDYNELGYYAFFYTLQDDKLTLLRKVPIPRGMEES